MDEKRFMSLEDVAKLLGVNYQLVYRLVRERELPAAKLGRVYRVDRADLETYLSRSKATASETGHTCAACGKRYAAAASVGEECSTCGAPICRDCWSRMGRRTCAQCAGQK